MSKYGGLTRKQLADALDAANAELARVNARLVDLTGQLHAERITASEDMARALRAAMAEPADTGHNEPCHMCDEPCNSLAGNPSRWPVHLGNAGWHHVGCVTAAMRELQESRAEIARMRTTIIRDATRQEIYPC